MKTISKKTIRKCPICNNEESHFLHKQKFSIPEGYFLSPEYDIVSCKKCGFVFADTLDLQESYDKYYEFLSKYESKIVGTGTGINENDKQRLKNISKRVSKYLTDGADAVIDIGCANGGLLSELKERGFDNLTGMDPSEVCVENVRARGFKAFKGSIVSLNKSNSNKFHCAILSGVLEHIYNIDLAIKNISSLIENNGYIYIEVPDVLNYLSHYLVPYYYFDLEHINHFSINDINNLMLKNGFELIEYNFTEYYASSEFKYPDIYAIFRKRSDKITEFNETYSSESMNSIIEYIKKCNEDNMYNSTINKIANSNEEIVIWGVGMHTYRLLASSNLNKCNIAGFIDNDIKKQGKLIGERKIYSSDLLNIYSGTILLCSAFSNNAIKKQLLKLGVKNKIIAL